MGRLARSELTAAGGPRVRISLPQTALHAKAKAEAGYRFYALYDKISREDILAHAYAQCRSNKGAPGYRRTASIPVTRMGANGRVGV